MTHLPKQFRRDKFDFLQVVDLHPVYVYQKAKGDWMGWEVVKARWMGGRTWKDRVFSAGYTYPSSVEWGIRGWSCQTLDRARQKALELAKPVTIKTATEKQKV